MNIFFDYIKRSRIVQGKNIEIYLDGNKLKVLIRHLKRELIRLVKNQNVKSVMSIIKLHYQFNEKLIFEIVTNSLFDTFFKVIEDNL